MTLRTYINAEARATDKIRKYGGTVTVMRQSGVTDDVEGTGSTWAVAADGHALQTEYAATKVDGTNIQRGDKRFLVEAGAAVLEKDRIVMGGVTWAVIRVEEINPAGDFNILSKVQVRR